MMNLNEWIEENGDGWSVEPLAIVLRSVASVFSCEGEVWVPVLNCACEPCTSRPTTFDACMGVRLVRDLGFGA